MSAAQRVSRGFHRLGAGISTSALSLALLLSVGSAKSDDAMGHLGQVAWSAFQCATFAAMAKREVASQRLFDVGLKAGRDFIEAVENGKVSDEELNSIVPTGVTMLLSEGGPSTDFLLGRIYSAAQESAYDKIVKQDAAGLPLDTEHWVMDKKQQAPRAETSYSKSNCELIR
jgi:hypothetical protein